MTNTAGHAWRVTMLLYALAVVTCDVPYLCDVERGPASDRSHGRRKLHAAEANLMSRDETLSYSGCELGVYSLI